MLCAKSGPTKAKEGLPAKPVVPRMGVVKGKPHPSPSVLFLDVEEKPKVVRRRKVAGQSGRAQRVDLHERAYWTKDEDIFVSIQNNNLVDHYIKVNDKDSFLHMVWDLPTSSKSKSVSCDLIVSVPSSFYYF